MGGKTANKATYFDRLKALLEDHRSVFIVSVDNVVSFSLARSRRTF